MRQEALERANPKSLQVIMYEVNSQLLALRYIIRFSIHLSNMPPLLLFLRPARALPLRSQAPIAAKYQPLCLRWTTRRHITADEKPLPEKEGNGPGPNQAQLPHVSEEAAALGEVTGEGGPDIEKEGTPVLEVHNTIDALVDRCRLIDTTSVGFGSRQKGRGDEARGFKRQTRI